MKRLAIVLFVIALCAPLMFADVCSSPNKVALPINTAASAQLITGTAGTNIYICSITVSVTTATNIAIVEGTGSTCATGVAGVIGGNTAATGLQLGATQTVTIGAANAIVAKTATKADNVCVLLSAANQTSGVLTYVKQ